MKDLARGAVDAAVSAGAQFAESRLVLLREEDIQTRNGTVSRLARTETIGIGVRALCDGAWGFASVGGSMSAKAAERAAAQAVKVARASARVGTSPVRLAPEPAHTAVWITPVRTDPFGVPLGAKVDLLRACDEAMMRVKGITVARSRLLCRQEHIWFANSEGSQIEQTLVCCGGGLWATAAGGGDMQQRSYPARDGQFASAGYEAVEALDLAAHAEPTAREAVELLAADVCPSRTCDLIIGGSHLALQIHESVGHPTELDRVLGLEANFAGTSFATVEKVRKLQYGAPIVNIVADTTLPGGVATRGFDDEGVAAQRWHLVRDGILDGYLMSRETAALAGFPRSNGAVRADGYGNVPIIRMTNISLMPGKGTLADLIAGTDDGIMVDTYRSWSIDQRRVNFQFGTEMAWEIRGGRRTRLLKNATYGGRTVDFWNSCDAICGPEEWRPWAVMNCGKGEPMQVARLSHGAAPARFRGVDVGVASRG